MNNGGSAGVCVGVHSHWASMDALYVDTEPYQIVILDRGIYVLP